MVHLDSESIDRCLDAVHGAIAGDAALAEDLRASRADFFPDEDDFATSGARVDGGEDARLADRRHLEWYLIERMGREEREERIALLIERCAEEMGLMGPEIAAALANSHASIFEVTHIDPGEGMKLWDLARLFEFPVVEIAGSRLLAEGDVIAGRIFPIGDSLHHVSRAAILWRNRKLLAALRKDFERARESRPPTERGSLRLRQSEIEAMFHARKGEDEAEGPEIPNAVVRARSLLLASGLESFDADEVLARLASEPLDPTSVLPGGGDVLGEILDALAFETSVDLETARAVLLAAWGELQGKEKARVSTKPHERSPILDVATAVAEFERKRREGAPLDQVFLELERDLDLDDDDELEDDPDEADATVPDFPGVVDAMVEEFLWDEERVNGEASARRFQALRGLGRSAAEVSLFEDLSLRELTDFACRWSIERGELRDPQQAADLVEGLSRFCRWAEENHDVRLRAAFESVLVALRDSLPRLALANRACRPDSEAKGQDWFEFVRSGDGGAAEVVELHRREPVTVSMDAGVLAHLCPGDLIRGHRRNGGDLALAACHPAELRRVLES